MINKELAIQRGLDPTVIINIQILQDFRDEIEGYASEDNNEEDYKGFFNAWMDVNRRLQKLWNFPQNDNYIKFWDFPKCTCPKLDNEDNYPKGYYIMSNNCIIHKNS